MAKSIHADPYKILIDCLKRLRKSAGCTQAELASQIGTDQSYVSKYERCERRLDIIELRTICIALGVELTDFLKTFESKLKGKGS